MDGAISILAVLAYGLGIGLTVFCVWDAVPKRNRW